MEYIVLENRRRVEAAGHSSKGNQLKWYQNGKWYKADHMGYEALAEVLVSALLQKSAVKNLVVYEQVQIEYKDRILNGCKSRNFLREGEELITVDHLYRQFTGRNLTAELAGFSEISDRILHLVNRVEEFTGLLGFGAYLTTALAIDAFFLNEDRHTNNIAVIYNAAADQFRLCPYFDHGLSLFADTAVDFPWNLSVEECRKKIVAKPFCNSFEDQLEAAEELYGADFRLNFTMQDVEQVLQQFRGFYKREILERVLQVIREQRRKYQYMFQQDLCFA